jgi:hypothetical protein
MPFFVPAIMRWSFVLLLALAGCGAAGQPASHPPATQYGQAPVGPLSYGASEEADAGFVRVTVDSQPCGEGLLGVQVRLHNTGHKVFETYQAEVSGRTAKGDVLSPARPAYGSPCKVEPRVQRLDPGEATTLWSFFAVEEPNVQVKVELTEPDGMAEFQAIFHLDRQKMDRPSTSFTRPAPPSPQLAMVDAPYYRMTVVGQRACTRESEVLAAYEVVFENFSNVQLGLGLPELVDNQGRRYARASHFMGPCVEDLGPGDGIHEVEPGQKRRGWLPAFAVGSDASGLVLQGGIRGKALQAESFALSLGALPAPEASPLPSPVATKPAPTERRSLSADPPAAEAPRFRDLEPIPTDPKLYEQAKQLHLFRSHHVVQGNFLMSVVPVTHQLWAAGFYPQWAEKRYDTAQMVKLTRQFIDDSKDVLHARLVLYHHANVMVHGGEHSLKIPEDIADYVFLELDGFQPVRCKAADIPLMGGLVGPFSKQTAITLTFDLPAGAAARLQSGRGAAKFVVGGLGFKDNTLRYDLPLSALTSDAPPELQRLFRAIASSK